MPSIFDTIQKDHQRHRRLLNEIADTSGDSTARREAWDALYRDVKSHAAAEEETFYSKLMTKTWGQDAARHSVHEHQQMDDLLEELNEKDMSSPGWLQRFETLRHDYEHHMDEEEDEVFARAREVFDKGETEGFAERFLKRKEKERGLIAEKRADRLED